MFEEVIVCLDGSSLAETILPLARAVTAPTGGKLTLLRVVGDEAELAAEESYLRDCARQYAARLSFAISADPAGAIATELKKNPHAIAAITTHGRTAWAEAILGGVAFQVIRESHRPVLVYRPIAKTGDAPKQIDTVVIALDGNALSEKIMHLRRASGSVVDSQATFSSSSAGAVTGSAVTEPWEKRCQRVVVCS